MANRTPAPQLPSLSGAQPKKRYHREKLNPGKNEVVVKDVRWHAGFKGKGFFIDFVVERDDQPTEKGFEGAYMVYPDNVKPSGRMTREMAYAAELGKIQVAIAALYGLPESEAAQIDDDVFAASLSTADAKSPLIGARFIMNQVVYTNKEGRETSFGEPYPHPEGNGLTAGKPAAKAQPAAPAKPSSPALPSKTKRPSFEEAYTAAGYQVHPEDENYLFNDTEVKLVSAVQAELGYLQG